MSLGLLLFTAPLCILISVAALIEQGWPLLERETLLGADGSEFSCLKFRVGGPRPNRGVRSLSVMAFIDQARLAGVPRLLSVVSGRMTLVGPPPRRSRHSAGVGKQTAYALKPGLIAPAGPGGEHLTYRAYLAGLARGLSLLLSPPQ